MSSGTLSPSDLTQILVHIYSRLRKGETTAAAAYREASSLLDALKEHSRARNGKKAPKPEVIVETAWTRDNRSMWVAPKVQSFSIFLLRS